MAEVVTRDGVVEYTFVEGDVSLAPLVFVHGGTGSVATWNRFPRLLAARTGRRALLFSRLGNGFSSPLKAPRTSRYVHEEGQERLPELLDLLGVQRPVVVGHSDGGSMALLYASVRPVEAVVALGPHLYCEESTVRGVRAARTSFDAGGAFAKRVALVHANPRLVVQGWSDVWLSPEFGDWSIEGDVEVAAPVLLIQGDQDEYGSLRQLDAAERVLRGPVRREVIEGGGHYQHMAEDPERLVEIIGAFLAEHADSHAAGKAQV
ncbi:alpha/beta fold hydrolase [Streptomyces sp. NPDC004296]|uniref:alpha/beta fold hydrolase n=1 Tax=Streptomyces sp. NPDC004296 TaxID=3364697 RepID=UPI0036ACECFB